MNISTKGLWGKLALSLVLAIGTLAIAQDTTQAPVPDNTKTNERDQNGAQATADQQKENRSDRDITRDIRRSIMQEKSLSTYAHNVKIVSQNGMVAMIVIGVLSSFSKRSKMSPHKRVSLQRFIS